MPIHEYPYTDFHEMNLDWLIKKMKELLLSWEHFGKGVTASAHESADPEVTVTGSLETELNFDFGLVKGDEGPQGPEGPQGKGLEILGVYATLSDLQTAHPTGNVGDVYLVGYGGSYDLYVWDEDSSDWVNGGPVTSPAPSVATPLMDGTASVGSSLNYSREDHVHPSDTSKQDALVSGTNIKTINSNSLLGAGDVTVQDVLVSGTNIKTINSESLLGSTDIAVQVPLVSGTNIKTINSESLLGSTDIAVQVPLVSGTNIKTINSESLLGSTDIAVQVPLVSGTNIKTINSNSLLGSGDITITPGALSADLLWTNASPTSSFASQTVALDLSDYLFVYLVTRLSQSRTEQQFGLYKVGGGATYLYGNEGNARFYRLITASSTGVTIGDCSFGTYNSSVSTSNGYGIPLNIYGIK